MILYLDTSSLVEAIPKDVCVLVYNMGFEKGVLRGLAKLFPELAERLMNIHGHIIGLMAPFQKKHYYVREMRGSFSIKSVLPALVPELSYAGMEISEGGGQNKKSPAGILQTGHLRDGEDIGKIGECAEG